MKSLRTPLHIVLYRDNGDWIAHCLEFDLLGDGPTQPAALECLAEAIRLQVEASLEQGNLANLFRPAGGKYFEMFAEGEDVEPGRLEPFKSELQNFGSKTANFQFESIAAREFLSEPVAILDT